MSASPQPSEILRQRLIGQPSENVQATFCAVLVDEWFRRGVTVAMVAPGSRSTPLALALLQHGGFRIEIFHDERAASFAALGSAMSSGIPAVLLCTSGTAATHFYGAVVESNLSQVPMLVVTADRPPELRHVGAPQTIDQIKMYGDHIRWFHDPGVAAIEASDSWYSLAARLVTATMANVPGPVHLNLPFREPLTGAAIDLIGTANRTRASTVKGSLGRLSVEQILLNSLSLDMKEKKGVIIAGRGAGSPASVAELSRALGWPIIADSRSGCQGLSTAVIHADSLLRSDSFTKMAKPEIVLRLGDAPSSKVLSHWVSRSGAPQIHVSAYGAPFDPDHRVTMSIAGDPNDFCLGMQALVGEPIDSSWMSMWTGADGLARKAILEYHDSSSILTGSAVARSIVQALAEKSVVVDPEVSSTNTMKNLVVSSSMPIRDLEWFGGDCSTGRIFSNRGANGIDGVLATAIGIAHTTSRETIVSMGDIAFVHDSSSLIGLMRRDVNIKIVVTDNDGGGIFHYLPQHSLISNEHFEMLFGTPHGTDIASLARSHGLPVEVISSPNELSSALEMSGTRLIHVRTDRDVDMENHRLLHQFVDEVLMAAFTHE